MVRKTAEEIKRQPEVEGTSATPPAEQGEVSGPSREGVEGTPGHPPGKGGAIEGQQGAVRQRCKGERIKRIRERHGLSQAQVASALDRVLKKERPTGSSYISMLENQRRRPSIEVVEALTEILRCRAAHFFEDEPEPLVSMAPPGHRKVSEGPPDAGPGEKATGTTAEGGGEGEDRSAPSLAETIGMERLLLPEEIAEILKVPLEWLLKMISIGKIEYIALPLDPGAGSIFRIKVSALKKYLERRTIPAR